MADLAKKLRIGAGKKALFTRGPSAKLPPGLLDGLALPEGAKAQTRGKGPFDVVVAFATAAADLPALFAACRDALAEDGVLWMAYPKKSAKLASDITRDAGWEPLTDAGWAPVTQVAIDETWSALRFRHAPELIEERRARGFMK